MAAGGAIIAILALVGLGLILLAILYGLSRFLGLERGRPQPLDYLAYGDCPFIPEGLAAPGNNRAGGRPGRPSAAVTQTLDRTHVGKGL